MLEPWKAIEVDWLAPRTGAEPMPWASTAVSTKGMSLRSRKGQNAATPMMAAPAASLPMD